MRTQPLIVGHRGAMAVAAENTLTSFARGVADGADLLELDVHLSRDGRLVVHHDETVDRMAVPGGRRTSGAIRDLDWPELQEVQLPQGQRIPALEEVLDAVEIPVLIEIKAVEAARGVAELLLARGESDRCTIISFHADALRAAREVGPALPTGFITLDPTPAAAQVVDELGCATYSVLNEHVTAALVTHWRDRGTTVITWPVHTPAHVEDGLEAGAALSADDPAWCRALVEELTGSRQQ